MEVSLRQKRRYNVEIKAVELGTKCSVNFFADTIALFALISKPTNHTNVTAFAKVVCIAPFTRTKPLYLKALRSGSNCVYT